MKCLFSFATVDLMNIHQVIRRFSLSMLACCTLAVTTTSAQTFTHAPLFTIAGDSTNDSFGESVRCAGDVNGDGIDDLIVGAALDNKNGSNSGSARVLSGVDGTIVHLFEGDSANDTFGFSVSGAGDVNGDGFADLIVGAPGDDNNGADSGSARVLSGFDGSVLYNFDGDAAGDELGAAVSGGSDINGDGVADLIVGIRGDDNNGADSGSVRVFSGADGNMLYNFDGDSAGDEFGFSVSNAFDVNGDGFADVLVGASGDDNTGTDSGSARVLSGFDGSILYEFNGDSAGDFMGRACNGAGDVDNDGFADLIVGIPLDDNNGENSGTARVFSGADGSVLYNFTGDSAGDIFGRSVNAGDVNGDGNSDLIVGAPRNSNNGAQSGNVRVFSGANGTLLYSVNGDSAGDSFGRSTCGADVNGDHLADLVVGAPGDDDQGQDNGSVRVHSGADGSVIYNFLGDSAGDILGRSVIEVGDVNGDGNNDLIEGAPLDDNNGADSGSVRVVSGAGGSVLFNFDGDSAGDQFGAAVGDAGDINGDGFDDLIVGAPFDDNNGADSGSARVISGANGSTLYTFDGDAAGDRFGASVSGAGDVNGDGFDDVMIGAPLADNNGTDSGSAQVFSGSDGSVLYYFDGDSAGDQFGSSVVGVGDVNADGTNDLIVGAPFDDNNGIDSGSAQVLSGANGTEIYNFDGNSAGDQFGFSARREGYLNDDLAAEFLISTSYETSNEGFLYFSQVKDPILGDCNQDCEVNMLDIAPFIAILKSESFLTEADCNQDGAVNFLDIVSFIEVLGGN